MPQVKVVDLSQGHAGAGEGHGEDDVIVMATDGLWDVMSNEKANEILRKSLSQFEIGNAQR